MKPNILHVALLVLFSITSCKEAPKNHTTISSKTSISVTHAQGFSIDNTGDFPIVTVTTPWPNAQKNFVYAFVPEETIATTDFSYNGFDAVVSMPIKKLVATSTTHIPALQELDGLSVLRGFPDTKYVSAMPARALIASGQIKELGQNETLNTELVLEMQPDALVGFATDGKTGTYDLLQKAGIPILYNGDWAEQTPLGKAEWIKFFGVLLGKQEQAQRIFDNLVKEYNEVKTLAQQATSVPKVLSGALYKDVWYLPAGESWAAKFLKDANTEYLWAATEGTGSLSLSLEAVIDQGIAADFWVSPSQFKSYEEMLAANPHYKNFSSFKDQKIYTYAATTGPTGGLLYYELGPHRPDLILKDLVHIFHPKLLPNHRPFFFQPLQ